MDKTQIITLLLGSAAIGALVSSFISELGKWRERKSRRQELLLQKAIELAAIHNEMRMRAADRSRDGGHVFLKDNILLTETYYQDLQTLLETGKLPPSTCALDEDLHPRQAPIQEDRQSKNSVK